MGFGEFPDIFGSKKRKEAKAKELREKIATIHSDLVGNTHGADIRGLMRDKSAAERALDELEGTKKY